MADLKEQLDREIQKRGLKRPGSEAEAAGPSGASRRAGAARRKISAGVESFSGSQFAPGEKSGLPEISETPELISRREFAKRMDISETAVRRAIDSGRIGVTQNKVRWPEARDAFLMTRTAHNNNRLGELPGERPEDLTDEETALRLKQMLAGKDNICAEFTEADMALPWPMLFSKYQALEKKEKAKLAELERLEREGELHHREDIIRALGDMQIAFRNRILAVGTKLAKRLADMTGYDKPGDILKMIEGETTAALAEMAKYDGAKIKSARRQRIGK